MNRNLVDTNWRLHFMPGAIFVALSEPSTNTGRRVHSELRW